MVNLLPVFLTGLLGGVHCIGMCGGIVSVFSAASPSRRMFPVAVTVQGGQAVASAPTFGSAAFMVAYNTGRIASYATAGAIAGGLAQGTRWLAGISDLQAGGYWLANLMLVAVGLYLMEIWRGVAQLEAAGRGVWKHVQPLVRHALPAGTPARALMLGALWGWLPCGMVYSMLVTALASGSAANGAAVMAVFGLGTLPALFAAGTAGSRMREWSQRRAVRMTGGAVIAAFGVLGIYRALHGLPHAMGDFCLGATL